MKKLFRKPTITQVLFQGLFAFIANKTVRRVLVTAVYVDAARSVYQMSKNM